MEKIKLPCGSFCIIDKEDFEKVSPYAWRKTKSNHKFYVTTSVQKNSNKKTLRIHRLIIGAKKGEVVDHINGDTLDCRKSNLRKCSGWQNSMNQQPQKNRSSKFKGVCKRKNSNRFTAQIKYNYKYIHIGSFSSEKEAAMAYDKKAKELFGEFACLNFN